MTRGDRYLTTDFTPTNLTAWGFQDCARDGQENNGSFGGMLGKLLLRTLPDNYPDNSVYAHFPFTVPTTAKSNLEALGLVHLYNFERPAPNPATKTVTTYKSVERVLANPTVYKTVYTENIRCFTGQNGCDLFRLSVRRYVRKHWNYHRLFFGFPGDGKRKQVVRAGICLTPKQAFNLPHSWTPRCIHLELWKDTPTISGPSQKISYSRSLSLLLEPGQNLLTWFGMSSILSLFTGSRHRSSVYSLDLTSYWYSSIQ